MRLGGEDLAQTNIDLDEEGWGELIDIELLSDELEQPEGRDNEVQDDEEPLQNQVIPETEVLLMPSSLSPFIIRRLKLEHLMDLELKMRIGQLNDSLDGLMLALCTQGLLLRTKVRNASGTKTKTRAFNEVTKVRREVESHVRSYRRARKALHALSIDTDLLNRYPPIKLEDLGTADLTDERRLGQSEDTLAWFWKLGAGQADKNKLKEECELLFLTYWPLLTLNVSVYRVSWLKGKARRDRWEEEVAIVSHEMLFVTLAHLRDADLWRDRAEKVKEDEGKKAFALAKMLVFQKRAEEAQKGFEGKVVKADWSK